MLLLTQAATTVAGPAFTLCISPKGRVCIDAPWTTCTCCQDDGVPDQDGQLRAAVTVQEEDKACQSERGCSCRCGHDNPPATAQAHPADTDALIAHGQPCRCKHIPLMVAHDAQQPAVERTSVDDRHSFDHLIPAPATPFFGGFSSLRDAVSLLPQPPPSGHLLVISCTVLRC
ncbi:MAG: hypothetical protein K2V38_10695 [Gemmataceae bacterium]|nr:hypothetical protein [Gemmataceae bacterium]